MSSKAEQARQRLTKLNHVPEGSAIAEATRTIPPATPRPAPATEPTQRARPKETKPKRVKRFTERVTLDLTPEQYEEVKERAYHNRLPMAEQIRMDIARAAKAASQKAMKPQRSEESA